MREIRITASWIDDSGYGVEYSLFLDSDIDPILRIRNLDKLISIAKDYLSTSEYKDEFIERIKNASYRS